MSKRRKLLPPRRETTTVPFEYNGMKFAVAYSKFADDSVAEVFLNTPKRAGSDTDINASDAAIAVSFALQFGCPLAKLAAAMRRNGNGSPAGLLAQALDVILEQEKTE